MAVIELRDGRARLVPVQLGARNGQEACVSGGLPAGAVVIVYPAAAVRDGVRVKPRRAQPTGTELRCRQS
jgi:HlyD family secretion protein